MEQRAHVLNQRYLTTPEGTVLKVTNILDQLQQPNGEPADLTNWIIKNQFKIVVSCGEPGIGKSTAVQQLAESLRIQGYNPHLVLFDNILAQTIDEVYEETGTTLEPLEFTDDIWNNKFADNVVNKVRETQREIDKFYEENPEQENKDIILLDFVGLISIFGKKALERIVEEYGDETGLIAMPPDLSTQIRSGSSRHMIVETAKKYPADVESRMSKSPHNLYVFWLPPEPETSEDKGQILGRTAEKAAAAKVISNVSRIVANTIDHDYNITMIVPSILDVIIQAIDEGKLPQIELSNLGFLARRIAYLLYQIEQLSLPMENSRIVLNIFNKNEPIVWVMNH